MQSPCRTDSSGKCAMGCPGLKCRKDCKALDEFQRSLSDMDTIRPAVDPSSDGYRFIWN